MYKQVDLDGRKEVVILTLRQLTILELKTAPIDKKVAIKNRLFRSINKPNSIKNNPLQKINRITAKLASRIFFHFQITIKINQASIKSIQKGSY